MNVPFDIVIPARYESSRLNGKLLLDICGKSMIHRVVERAFTSSAERVIVAVDDVRIEREVQRHTNATVCRTSKHHPSGTDRVAEAVTMLQSPPQRIVVNVQGDEPLIVGKLIDRVAFKLSEAQWAQVATAAKPLSQMEDLMNPNTVKCVVDKNGNALYFSRSQIPWTASENPTLSAYLQHIGIYAFRTSYLVQHAKRKVCSLETTEKLEQLRVLYNGDQIAVCVDESYEAIGVDTQQDLERVRKIVQQQEKI